jgi:hypothetical protein
VTIVGQRRLIRSKSRSIWSEVVTRHPYSDLADRFYVDRVPQVFVLLHWP